MCTEFECQNICKIYRLRNEEVPALQDVNFTVAEEEFICIVGPSGCGKTTLLKILAGLSEPSSGRIFSGLAPSDGRLHSAMVFQEHGLLPWLTTLDNVAFGLEAQGVKRQKRRERARTFIEQIGLAAFVIIILISYRPGCVNAWELRALLLPTQKFC
jgi:NitT/TauT family transport system ATP-binding protein